MARAAASASTSAEAHSARAKCRDLTACLREIHRADPNFEGMAGGAAWKEIAAFVRKMCEVMVQTLPNFWRVVRHYSEGKLVKKVSPSGACGSGK